MEIKRLKEKQEQFEQRLRSAEGEAARQLEKQLKSVSLLKRTTTPTAVSKPFSVDS